jgi:hypothetical protein
VASLHIAAFVKSSLLEESRGKKPDLLVKDVQYESTLKRAFFISLDGHCHEAHRRTASGTVTRLAIGLAQGQAGDWQ